MNDTLVAEGMAVRGAATTAGVHITTGIQVGTRHEAAKFNARLAGGRSTKSNYCRWNIVVAAWALQKAEAEGARTEVQQRR